MMRPSVAALIVFGFVVAVSTTSRATPRVAVSAIEGDDDGDLRDAVAEALDGKDLTVIGAKETKRAIKKLDAEVSDLTDKQAKKLSRDLEADAFLYVTFKKKERFKLLHFSVYIKGHKTKGFSVQFSNARSKKFKRALRDKIIDKLASAPADKPERVAENDSGDGDEDVPKKGKKGTKAKKGKKSKNGKKGKKSKKTQPTDADDEGEDEDAPRRGDKDTASLDEEDGDEGDEDVEASVTVKNRGTTHPANRAAVRVDVGISATARKLIFTSTPELRAADQDPKPFQPKPVAGARVEGEIYPLAFSNPTGIAAGLGIAFEYDRVLSSKVKTSAEPNAVGKVKQQHYLIGGRFRIPFGKSATAPSVMVGIGYGQRTFVVSSGLMVRSDLDLPDTDYKYIAPALGFRIPFTVNVAFSATGEAMLVRDAGAISTAAQYGKAKVFGVDAEAGIDIIFGKFAFRVAGELTQVGFSFTGGGDLAKNRDMDPTTIDIGGAADRTIGGVATFAVLY